MDHRTEIFALILCGLLAIVTSITITSNGNSPKIKMLGGMMVDVEDGFMPMKFEETTTIKNVHVKSPRKKNNNSTKLSINERYRRLIPYMTFYYANDLANPTTDNAKEIEVEKAQIIESAIQRDPKKIISQYPNRNIPRYQGNRLTHHNIASSNPTKIYYKGGVPVYASPSPVTPNHNPLLSEYVHNDYDSGRVIYKQAPKSPGFPFLSSTRKPFLNLYNEDSPNIRYYLSEKEHSPKYKLVPYEQTPPVKVLSENENNYHDIANKPIPVSVLIPKDQPLYLIKPRPARPHYVYENVNVQQPVIRKQPSIVSENYYEKQRPSAPVVQPIVHSGFKPIFNSQFSKESYYTTASPENNLPDHEPEKQQEVRIQSSPVITINDFKPLYHKYVVDQTTVKPPPRATPSNTIPLASLLNSLQLNKSIPKPITKENVGSSIRTLLQVLNALKAVPQKIEIEYPVLSTPKPFVSHKVQITPNAETEVESEIETTQPEPVHNEDLHEDPYLADVSPPSQHLDDHPTVGGTSQQFPLQITSDDEGGTPGRPGVDYPILTVIPPTSFDCKTQRYKGFFADPATRCQVWHYCDLNGGQASFLCPNGTIFSQAGLTCDWWFNVQCATTTQLYVLNESLYKYILPHSPKFPEDYSGPLVDKYLTLKFKEMEEQFKKNKNKQSASEKADSDEEGDDEEKNSDDDSEEKEDPSETDISRKDDDHEKTVNEASVILESPGSSGNVERLQDD